MTRGLLWLVFIVKESQNAPTGTPLECFVQKRWSERKRELERGLTFYLTLGKPYVNVSAKRRSHSIWKMFF